MNTFLVTGGTSGVGKAIAIGIAKTGVKVIIVGRNEVKAEIAVREITEASGNVKVSFICADLSLITDVNKLCETIKSQQAELSGIVNAAGGWFFKKAVTAEGLDYSFAVNYLSHFALSTGLLDLLKKTGEARILTVGGNPLFLKDPKLKMDDLQLQRSYSGFKAASYGMFARIYFAFEMADRLKGTTVSSMVFHPGFVKSNLANDAPWWLKIILNLWPSVRNAPETCESGVYVATKSNPKSTNGQFFNEKSESIEIRHNFDPAIGKQLWQISEALVSKIVS